MNYQKNSNIKDKIKGNVHFHNTFTIKNEKDKSNDKLKLRNVGIKKGRHLNDTSLLRKVKWNAKYKIWYSIGITYN